MSTVSVAVVGVGRLGAEHVRILRDLPGVRLAGVYDSDPERCHRIGEQFGIPHHEDLASLLEEVSAAVVAVPTPDHFQVAAAALSAGCHVLVEKPFAETLEEADELIALAGDLGLRLAVGHVERYNAALRAGMPYLDDPRFIATQRLAPFQPRGTDVPVVLDLMIHDIDLVLGLVPSAVAHVHAVGVPVLTESIDIANARLVFENGAVAEINASRVSQERSRELRLFQPSGYMSLDLARGRGEFLRRRWIQTPATGSDPSSDFVERIPLEGDAREPLRLELEAFVAAVTGADGGPVVEAREGRAALEMALRIEREIEQAADVVARNP